jgi:hypothetical protein
VDLPRRELDYPSVAPSGIAQLHRVAVDSGVDRPLTLPRVAGGAGPFAISGETMFMVIQDTRPREGPALAFEVLSSSLVTCSLARGTCTSAVLTLDAPLGVGFVAVDGSQLVLVGRDPAGVDECCPRTRLSICDGTVCKTSEYGSGYEGPPVAYDASKKRLLHAMSNSVVVTLTSRIVGTHARDLARSAFQDFEAPPLHALQVPAAFDSARREFGVLARVFTAWQDKVIDARSSYVACNVDSLRCVVTRLDKNRHVFNVAPTKTRVAMLVRSVQGSSHDAFEESANLAGPLELMSCSRQGKCETQPLVFEGSPPPLGEYDGIRETPSLLTPMGGESVALWVPGPPDGPGDEAGFVGVCTPSDPCKLHRIHADPRPDP